MTVQEQLRQQKQRLEEALGSMTERQVIHTMSELRDMANHWRRKNNHVGYMHNVEMIGIARRHLCLSRTDGKDEHP